MYSYLDLSTANSGLGTPLRSGGQIINDNFSKLHAWMQRRSNILTENIPTLAAGGPPYLLATEFSAGNPMPLTSYKRRDTAPSDTTNPAYVQSLDGQWWELQPSGGEVYIEQFGGKADYVANLVGVTDNYGPMTKAIAFVARTWTAVAKITYKIKLGIGEYWFSDTLDCHTTTWIEGRNWPRGKESWATYCWFPSEKTCVIISQNNTSGEGASSVTPLGQGNGTTLDGITFAHRWATGSFGPLPSFNVTNPAPGQGVHSRAVCFIRNCAFLQIRGHGIYIHGISGGGGAREGAPNEWGVEGCEVHSCGGDGLRISDQDANAGAVNGFTTRTCGGCGIFNDSAFVNTMTGIHLAGYGNWVVRYGGRLYQLINGAGTTTPATTTPGTNDFVWYDMGTDNLTGSPHVFDWSPTLDFTLYRAPIWDAGGATIYNGPYVEMSVSVCHVQGGSAIVGGTNACTRYTNKISWENGSLRSQDGFKQQKDLAPGVPGYTRYGPNPYVKVGGENNIWGLGDNGGPSILSWSCPERIGPAEDWQLSYFVNRIVMQSAFGTAFTLQTQFSTDTFGRDAPDTNRGRMVIPDPIIVDPNDLDGRRIGMRNVRPTTSDPGGAYKARGEFFFTRLPRDFGALGWSCITAGSTGAEWGTVPVFGIPSVDPVNNGECVLENTSNTQAKLKYRGSDGVVRSITFTLA